MFNVQLLLLRAGGAESGHGDILDVLPTTLPRTGTLSLNNGVSVTGRRFFSVLLAARLRRALVLNRCKFHNGRLANE